MLLVREVMYCRPGKVRPMVQKFLEMSKKMNEKGMGSVRVLTDMAGERYWTAVAEFEVDSLADFEAMMADTSMEEFGPIMEGYHDLVARGRREIYTVENGRSGAKA